mmetsp:Transcript_39285/g.122263  ORF Transcript_39285/g.122263 Transcript_39285/m.122263 type:complete len:273 (+) Transcript_39285:420-1238(+)
MVHHTLALGDEVEEMRKDLGILHERVALLGHRCVHELLLLVCQLLPSLHSHLDVGYQDVVLRERHLGVLHHKPLSASPSLLLPLEVPHVLHAHDRLLEHGVPHGQLLQVIVCLEEHLADHGSLQPRGAERLHLPVLVGARGVQGEVRGHARLDADLEGRDQVEQVHRGLGVLGLQQLQLWRVAALQRQAVHGLRGGARRPRDAALAQEVVVPRHHRLGPPADVVLGTVASLLPAVLLPPNLVLRLRGVEQVPCHALPMKETLAVLARVLCCP